MVNQDIINTWMCYKISNGGREELKTPENTSEMTFEEDGRLVYRFTGGNMPNNDPIDRHWKISYRNDMPVLLINDQETYNIISLGDGILVLESIKGEGFRHYYATIATYEFRKDKLV